MDDVSGEAQNCENRVRAARLLEMEYFVSMGVYNYATRHEASRSGKGNIL